MLDRWQHLGHSLGECWYDLDKSVSFVHIPKNASSFIKGCLISSDRFSHSPSLVTADTYLVALRDPIDRWCSGIAQFVSNPINQKLTEAEILEKITWDDHTELQTYFLQDIDLDRCVFFLVNRNLRTNLAKWLKQNGYNFNIDDVADLNTSEANGVLKIKQHYQNLMETVDGTSPIKLKLLKHYAKDYDLINQVRFYD